MLNDILSNGFNVSPENIVGWSWSQQIEPVPASEASTDETVKRSPSVRPIQRRSSISIGSKKKRGSVTLTSSGSEKKTKSTRLSSMFRRSRLLARSDGICHVLRLFV